MFLPVLGLGFVPILGFEGCIYTINSEGFVAMLGFEKCERPQWALRGVWSERCVYLWVLRGVCLCWVLGMSVGVICIWSVCAHERFYVCVCAC